MSDIKVYLRERASGNSEFSSRDGNYVFKDYGIDTTLLSTAYVEVKNGRFPNPDSGKLFKYNTKSTEIAHVIRSSGGGLFLPNRPGDDNFMSLSEGNVVTIPPRAIYAWQGYLELFIVHVEPYYSGQQILLNGKEALNP